ncbi:hypothetical protein GOP47_0023216 [Adiantum capillus-veneris]|uniref:Uncharacterized protein n=1 Tax=Adiantum capillus-veneris TaxID=13818 RepID=A0A9D4Z6R3_ADICA|nr:hypothetical protein GOP47_0023216 [Adiantum capillus-veneris]
MPLPKPSKMISKRLKKPRFSNPAFSPPPDLSKTPWRASPSCCEWRIRVVCTDPDATDDSSSDEAEPSPSTARKRLVHEFCIPLPSPSPPTTSQRCRMRNPSPQPTRSSRHNFASTKAETSTLLHAASAVANTCPPSPLSSSSVGSADAEEEFTRFLREFLTEQDEESLWECDGGRSQMHQESISLAEMLDLELDAEALSWINSMQRVP